MTQTTVNGRLRGYYREYDFLTGPKQINVSEVSTQIHKFKKIIQNYTVPGFFLFPHDRKITIERYFRSVEPKAGIKSRDK